MDRQILYGIILCDSRQVGRLDVGNKWYLKKTSKVRGAMDALKAIALKAGA